MIETTSVDGATRAFSVRPASRKDCGFTATTSVSTVPASFGLSRMPLAASALISADGIGSITTTRLGVEPAREPARQHRAAHLARAGECDGAGDVFQGAAVVAHRRHHKYRCRPAKPTHNHNSHGISATSIARTISITRLPAFSSSTEVRDETLCIAG